MSKIHKVVTTVWYNREDMHTLRYIFPEAELVYVDSAPLTLPHPDQPQHLINQEPLQTIKTAAFLVNMARGGIICTKDLVEALEEGTIGGAGLDVFEEEPLPAESPLWKMPNVYITPHCTPQVPHRTGRSLEIIRENARRFENGEPMMNLLRKSDAVSAGGQKSGWAKLMNSNLPKEQIAKMDLEKFLGKRGWTSPEEWM